MVIHCSSFCFGAAPIWREAIWPSLKIISVGIDWMPYFAAVCGILVDVELDDLHLFAERTGDLLERGRDHPARAAPLRPEIHHDRAGRLQHLGFESGVRNLANGHGKYLVVLGMHAKRRVETVEPMNAAAERQGGLTPR